MEPPTLHFRAQKVKSTGPYQKGLRPRPAKVMKTLLGLILAANISAVSNRATYNETSNEQAIT